MFFSGSTFQRVDKLRFTVVQLLSSFFCLRISIIKGHSFHPFGAFRKCETNHNANCIFWTNFKYLFREMKRTLKKIDVHIHKHKFRMVHKLLANEVSEEFIRSFAFNSNFWVLAFEEKRFAKRENLLLFWSAHICNRSQYR